MRNGVHFFQVSFKHQAKRTLERNPAPCGLLELFVHVVDFCQVFLPKWRQSLLADSSKKRKREGQLSRSEIMTIIIYFHQSRYRNFKSYYLEHVCKYLQSEFPGLVSYERFVILMPLVDKLLLHKRSIIETVNDQLKNISQIEHTRHRSPINCFINILAGLIAYCHRPKKPSLNLAFPGTPLLAA